MKKRLLLDGIALHSSNVSPGNVELPTAVVADFADSRLSLRNWATMPASKAADAVPFDFLVQLALADVLMKNFLKRRQRLPLGLF
jgi:hypothetical protein